MEVSFWFGLFFLSLALVEYQNDGFKIVDYITYTEQIYVYQEYKYIPNPVPGPYDPPPIGGGNGGLGEENTSAASTSYLVILAFLLLPILRIVYRKNK